LTDSIRKLLDQYNMPSRIARESTAAAGEIIDDLLNKYDSAEGGLSMACVRPGMRWNPVSRGQGKWHKRQFWYRLGYGG
jgi:hypothetical protein